MDVTASARRARRLEYATLAWDGLEAVVTIVAGIVAGSLALIAFGFDSAIEIVSAAVVLAHLIAQLRGTEPDEARERLSLRVIAGTFFALALYVFIDALRALAEREHPASSPVGIAFTAIAFVVMTTLARAKRSVASELLARGLNGPAALLRADAAETALCATLGLTTLVGLALNALFGWWWADAVASLVIVWFAIREGREAWAGELLCEDHD